MFALHIEKLEGMWSYHQGISNAIPSIMDLQINFKRRSEAGQAATEMVRHGKKSVASLVERAKTKKRQGSLLTFWKHPARGFLWGNSLA